MEQQKILSVVHLFKRFEESDHRNEVLNDISFDLFSGEFICILGDSGCGKTTLLRIIGGFERPDSGEVLLDGKGYVSPSPEVLLLFQDFNQLFPWKTVKGNVMYSLLATHTAQAKEEAGQIADAVLEEVGLYEFRNHLPKQLSGGMKQRAAVARALVLKPEILLMDEPFASLDRMTRSRLQRLTREKCKKYGISVLFVTHDIEEAVILSDRIIVMDPAAGGIKSILNNHFPGGNGEPDLKNQMMTTIINILSSN